MASAEWLIAPQVHPDTEQLDTALNWYLPLFVRDLTGFYRLQGLDLQTVELQGGMIRDTWSGAFYARASFPTTGDIIEEAVYRKGRTILYTTPKIFTPQEESEMHSGTTICGTTDNPNMVRIFGERFRTSLNPQRLWVEQFLKSTDLAGGLFWILEAIIKERYLEPSLLIERTKPVTPDTIEFLVHGQFKDLIMQTTRQMQNRIILR